MSAVSRPSIPPIIPLLTGEEFAKRYPKHWVELVDGIVKEVAMPGFEHGMVVVTIARLLGNFVADHSLGRVVSNDTYFYTRHAPDVVRGMDVAYISYARLPKGPVPRGPLDVAPELVVEVRSPYDAWTDVFAKVEEYLAAGVPVVLVADPEKGTVSALRKGPTQEDFHDGDTLTVPDVLPGFAVEVARLFE
jgi:Uma2 family endonuclease